MIRVGAPWVCVAFDCDGKVIERGLRFGSFIQVSEAMMLSAHGRVRGFDLAGAFIASPTDLNPDELARTVNDALVLKLSSSFAGILPSDVSAAWCRKER